MKKSFALIGLGAMMLAACSGNGGSADTAKGTTESATVEHDGSEITATLTKDADGKLTSVNIDEVTEDGESTKDLGDDYDMKKASTIGKEWFEQVEYLENFILENGVDAVKMDDAGYAENEDLKSGCTINISNFMKAVDEANAK